MAISVQRISSFVFFGVLLSQGTFLGMYNTAFGATESPEGMKSHQEVRREIDERQQNRQDFIDNRQEEHQEKRCNRLLDQWDRVIDRVEMGKERVANRLSSTSNEMTSRRAENDNELSQFRVGADERRQKIYDELENVAEGDAQAEAVAAFSQANEEAVELRRGAIDDAIEIYRTGVDSLAEERVREGERDYDTLMSSVESVYLQALATCEDGDDDYRKELRSGLSKAREEFRESRTQKRQTFLQENLKELRDTRRVAVAEAVGIYRETLADLLDELSSVLGKVDISIELDA